MEFQSANIIFCCDADALIDFERAGRFESRDFMAERDRLRIPTGVYREVLGYRGIPSEVKRTLQRWLAGGRIVVDADTYTGVKVLLPSIEKAYGPKFSLRGRHISGILEKQGRP